MLLRVTFEGILRSIVGLLIIVRGILSWLFEDYWIDWKIIFVCLDLVVLVVPSVLCLLHTIYEQC